MSLSRWTGARMRLLLLTVPQQDAQDPEYSQSVDSVGAVLLPLMRKVKSSCLASVWSRTLKLL